MLRSVFPYKNTTPNTPWVLVETALPAYGSRVWLPNTYIREFLTCKYCIISRPSCTVPDDAKVVCWSIDSREFSEIDRSLVPQCNVGALHGNRMSTFSSYGCCMLMTNVSSTCSCVWVEACFYERVKSVKDPVKHSFRKNGPPSCFIVWARVSTECIFVHCAEVYQLEFQKSRSYISRCMTCVWSE